MSLTVSEESLQRLRRFVEKYCEKSGTSTHPDKDVTEAVVRGLAHRTGHAGQAAVPVPLLSRQKRGSQTSHVDLRLR